MYIHVLTAPHLLQSSIWFTAVHKIIETMGGRAFWSSQIPPPAGRGTIASTKPGQTWLRFHKLFVLCYIRTSTYFLIKGSHNVQVWFALHKLIRIFLIIILSFAVCLKMGSKKTCSTTCRLTDWADCCWGPADCLSSRLEWRQPFIAMRDLPQIPVMAQR